MSRGITPENLLRSLPEVLRGDSKMLALATAIAGALSARPAEIAALEIYNRIDELPETLLDILAYDFKVDWWDADFKLEEKRQTLKASWDVHRHLGTPYAVERALSAIYPESTVREWFEYGGDPFHFRLMIPVDQTTLDLTKHARVLALVNFYKNLRSILDEVEYFGSGGSATAYAATAFIGCEMTIYATAHNY
jgi:phage tail P2-like protein